MLSLHEQAIANLIANAWTGQFHHSYEMPPRRGSSANWVQWHTAQNFSISPYEWRCSSLTNAADQYAWDDILLEQRKRKEALTAWTSDECRERLALSHDDPVAFHLACLRTLNWGKVGRSRNGKENASITWLDEALQRGSIVQEVLEAVTLLNGSETPERRFGVTLPMNSAMTKIYAFADTSKSLVIYDGRVGAALALFAMRYWQPKDGQLPAELRFAYFDSQTPGKRGSRNPSVGRYEFPALGRHTVHARWMWSASRMLNESARQAKCDVLQLERALFMIGYDVSRAKVHYAS